MIAWGERGVHWSDRINPIVVRDVRQTLRVRTSFFFLGALHAFPALAALQGIWNSDRGRMLGGMTLASFIILTLAGLIAVTRAFEGEEMLPALRLSGMKPTEIVFGVVTAAMVHWIVVAVSLTPYVLLWAHKSGDGQALLRLAAAAAWAWGTFSFTAHLSVSRSGRAIGVVGLMIVAIGSLSFILKTEHALMVGMGTLLWSGLLIDMAAARVDPRVDRTLLGPASALGAILITLAAPAMEHLATSTLILVTVLVVDLACDVPSKNALRYTTALLGPAPRFGTWLAAPVIRRGVVFAVLPAGALSLFVSARERGGDLILLGLCYANVLLAPVALAYVFRRFTVARMYSLVLLASTFIGVGVTLQAALRDVASGKQPLWSTGVFPFVPALAFYSTLAGVARRDEIAYAAQGALFCISAVIMLRMTREAWGRHLTLVREAEAWVHRGVEGARTNKDD